MAKSFGSSSSQRVKNGIQDIWRLGWVVFEGKKLKKMFDKTDAHCHFNRKLLNVVIKIAYYIAILFDFKNMLAIPKPRLRILVY